LLLARPNSKPDGSVNGHWVITGNFLGTPFNASMELKQQAEKITGDFDGDKLEGTLSGDSLHSLLWPMQ